MSVHQSSTRLILAMCAADSGAIHAGAVLSAEPERRGATMAIQSLFGFAIASVSPLAIGIVLDLTGSGRTANSWGAAFVAMGVVVAMGPIILTLVGRNREQRPDE